MDDDRDFQMNKKNKFKSENLKEDKIFVEHWKERMKELVYIIL